MRNFFGMRILLGYQRLTHSNLAAYGVVAPLVSTLMRAVAKATQVDESDVLVTADDALFRDTGAKVRVVLTPVVGDFDLLVSVRCSPHWVNHSAVLAYGVAEQLRDATTAIVEELVPQDISVCVQAPEVPFGNECVLFTPAHRAARPCRVLYGLTDDHKLAYSCELLRVDTPDMRAGDAALVRVDREAHEVTRVAAGQRVVMTIGGVAPKEWFLEDAETGADSVRLAMARHRAYT
jgi:hypothetical protein